MDLHIWEIYMDGMNNTDKKQNEDKKFNIMIPYNNIEDRTIEVTAKEIDEALGSTDLVDTLNDESISDNKRDVIITGILCNYIKKKVNDGTFTKIIKDRQEEYMNTYHKYRLEFKWLGTTVNLLGKDIILYTKAKKRIIIAIILLIISHLVTSYVISSIIASAGIVLLWFNFMTLMPRIIQAFSEK